MIITKMLFFGIIGLFVEIVYKAIKNAFINKDWTFTGEASLLMIPIYGLVVFIFPFIRYRVSSYGLLIRGLSYSLTFLIIQYVIGWILNKVRMCPWQYKGRLAFGGGVLSFAMIPVFFVAGLFVEYLYPIVIRLYNAI